MNVLPFQNYKFNRRQRRAVARRLLTPLVDPIVGFMLVSESKHRKARTARAVARVNARRSGAGTRRFIRNAPLMPVAGAAA